MTSFFNKIVDVLNENSIPYMLSGSVAMGIYILPRATKDFDFVLHLQEKDVKVLMDNFKDGYDIDADSINDAIKRQSIFNIIDHSSGYKADFIIIKNDAFSLAEFGRRKRMDYFGKEFFLITVEDLILSKMIWIQDYQSPLQMEDLKNLLVLNDLDWLYINDWVTRLKLKTFNLINQ